MFKRFIALAGAGVAAGALALTAAGTAGAVVVEPVTITALPTSINGTVGTPITTVNISTTLDPVMVSGGATVALTEAGALPNGVLFSSNAGSGSLAGTPTAGGAGHAVVTATATESKTFNNVFDLTNVDFFDATNCSYKLGGTLTFPWQQDPEDATVIVTNIDRTGLVSYTLKDPDGNPTSQDLTVLAGSFQRTFGSDTGATVSKVCTAFVDVPWDVVAPPTPTVTVTTTPTSTGVPTGGVQTGGGLPVHNSSDGWLFLLIIPAAAFLGWGYNAKLAARRAGDKLA